MNRRSLGIAALFAGALFVGTLAGGAASVPSAYAKASPVAPQQEPAADQAPAKKAPPTQCKTTKDCPQDHICTKVSDHKECTPTAIRPPAAPVVT
jgi:hypothetical protein